MGSYLGIKRVIEGLAPSKEIISPFFEKVDAKGESKRGEASLT